MTVPIPDETAKPHYGVPLGERECSIALGACCSEMSDEQSRLNEGWCSQERGEMTRDEFLHWEATTYDAIDVKRIYIDIAGDLVAGVLLSQLIYWFLPAKKRSSKSQHFVERYGRQWLMRRRQEWEEDIRVSIKQFDRAKRALIEQGLVQERKIRYHGSPITGLSLEFETLAQRVSSMLTEGDNGTSPKGNMELDQRGNSMLTEGDNGTSPKGNMELDQRGNSSLSLKTEDKIEDKIEDKTKRHSPLYPSPPSDSVGAHLPGQDKVHDEPLTCEPTSPPALVSQVEQGRLLFAELLDEFTPPPHAHLQAFLQSRSLEQLGLLIEFDRDVLYRKSNGELPHQKRAWINPRTTCAPDHVNSFLLKAEAWASQGKPLSWPTDQERNQDALGLSYKTSRNLRNTAQWGEQED